MKSVSLENRQAFRSLDRTGIQQHQLRRLNELLDVVLPQNQFYASRFGAGIAPLKSLQDFYQLPTITKSDLVASATQIPASFHTFPRDKYIRLHRTSGTQGLPLPVLDTKEDWQWWIETWQYVLDTANVSTSDRVFMAFSFGPFIGFWSANDALLHRGALVIPGGGMSTASRLSLMLDVDATVLCCTPTYALHMAQVADQENFDLRASSVRCVIVAGEPGGSIPEVRKRIAKCWDAEVLDHSGATEIGPWGVGTSDGTSLQVIESEFVAEFLTDDGDHAADGQLSELVLTNLGRFGAPVIRYRTGDLVRPKFDHDDPCRFVRLQGGVLGRADDMVVIRGVNVFPSSIEQVLRSFPELGEFRITLTKEGEMDQLSVEVEDPQDNPSRISNEFEKRIGLRVSIASVPMDSFERFEAKARRIIDKR